MTMYRHRRTHDGAQKYEKLRTNACCVRGHMLHILSLFFFWIGDDLWPCALRNTPKERDREGQNHAHLMSTINDENFKCQWFVCVCVFLLLFSCRSQFWYIITFHLKFYCYWIQRLLAQWLLSLISFIQTSHALFKLSHTHIHTNKQRNSAHNAAFNDKSITHFSTVILLFILITCTTSLGTACHWHILLLQFKSFKNSKYGILKGTSWLKMRK